MARKTKEEAIATRNGLIDAAEVVFLEKGVSRASLGDIAQAAGASRGAIYWHFRDKVDLFNAMMERVCLPLEQGSNAFDSSPCPDPVQRLRAVMALVLSMVSSDQRTRRVFEIALYRVEYVTELAGVRERHVAASEAFTSQLACDFEVAARMQGIELPMTAMEAAIGLHALFNGLMQSWILNEGAFDLVRVGRVSTDAYLSGLGLSLPPVFAEIEGVR